MLAGCFGESLGEFLSDGMLGIATFWWVCFLFCVLLIVLFAILFDFIYVVWVRFVLLFVCLLGEIVGLDRFRLGVVVDLVVVLLGWCG